MLAWTYSCEAYAYIPLIIWAHTTFEVDIFFVMLLRIFRILRQGLQGKRWVDFEIQDATSFQCDEVALEAVDNSRQHIAHDYEWCRKLGC